MFIGRRLTRINADKIIKNLRSSALICGRTNIKKPAQQRATLFPGAEGIIFPLNKLLLIRAIL
jgi:hypothetical protein